MPPALPLHRWSAPALAAVAGFADAVGYVTLNVFTAHMSGNTARLGVYLGEGRWHLAALAIFAIVVFVAAVTLGAAVMEVGTRRGWQSPDAGLLTAQAVLLLIFAVVGTVCSRHEQIRAQEAAVFFPLVACVVAAMGLQTASLQRLSGNTVRTTFVTGMLTNLADEMAILLTRQARRADRPHHRGYLTGQLRMPAGADARQRIRLILAIWLSYAAGAIGGSYLHGQWGVACMALPVAALAGLAASAYWNPPATPDRGQVYVSADPGTSCHDKAYRKRGS